MEFDKIIIIKSPRLQKIRNNLFDEMDKISLYEDGRPKSVRYMTSDEKSRFRTLQEEQNRLKDLANRSICKCVACGKADRDMVYNKAYDAWYCTECYGLERLTAQKRDKARQEGPKSSEEKAIDEHSKTFL